MYCLAVVVKVNLVKDLEFRTCIKDVAFLSKKAVKEAVRVDPLM